MASPSPKDSRELPEMGKQKIAIFILIFSMQAYLANVSHVMPLGTVDNVKMMSLIV